MPSYHPPLCRLQGTSGVSLVIEPVVATQTQWSRGFILFRTLLILAQSGKTSTNPTIKPQDGYTTTQEYKSMNCQSTAKQIDQERALCPRQLGLTMNPSAREKMSKGWCKIIKYQWIINDCRTNWPRKSLMPKTRLQADKPSTRQNMCKGIICWGVYTCTNKIEHM